MNIPITLNRSLHSSLEKTTSFKIKGTKEIIESKNITDIN